MVLNNYEWSYRNWRRITFVHFEWIHHTRVTNKQTDIATFAMPLNHEIGYLISGLAGTLRNTT